MLRYTLIACLVLSAPLLASCKDKSHDSTNAPSSRSSDKRGPVIDGEHFVTRSVIDHQQGGLIVGIMSAPEKWKLDSQVVWKYENMSQPVTVSLSVVNPANLEALYSRSSWDFFCLRPDSRMHQANQNYGGLLFAHQTFPPAQTLTEYARRSRGAESKFRVIGSKDLPDLPAALKMPASENNKGIAVKVSYEMNGQPVEEEFYAVYYLIQIPYDGPQGRTYQINWGLYDPHSFRAPAGTLEKRRPVFAAMAKSFRINPAWQARQRAVNSYLAEEFNRQLKAGYDQIAAAGRLSKQISANSDAFLANIDHQLAASHTSSSGSSSGSSSRSSTDNFDDYLRGVDTVNDPYYGTSQHSLTEQYHWTDGYGSYRNSNDGTYNPNQHENGDWQLMEPAR